MEGTVRIVAGAEGAVPKLFYPRPCALRADGSVVFVQRLENVVRLLREGRVITLSGGEEGFADGPRPRFKYPSGGALERSGRHLLVADRDNSRLRRVALCDGSATTVMRFPTNVRPCVVAVTSSSVFVAVSDCKDGAHCLVEIKNGQPILVAGRHGERGHSDGIGEDARFSVLYAAAVGNDDRIYLADGNRVRVFDPAARSVATLAGTVQPGMRDGPVATAQFMTVRGIAVDSEGDLYVSDFGNDCVRKLDLGSDLVFTLAGGSDHGKTANGTGTQASISTPCSLVLDDINGRLVVGTGDDTLVAVTVKSKYARFRAKLATIHAAFYLFDRHRAFLKPAALSEARHSKALRNVMQWLAATRARPHLITLIFAFVW